MLFFGNSMRLFTLRVVFTIKTCCTSGTRVASCSWPDEVATKHLGGKGLFLWLENGSLYTNFTQSDFMVELALHQILGTPSSESALVFAFMMYCLKQRHVLFRLNACE